MASLNPYQGYNRAVSTPAECVIQILAVAIIKQMTM